MSPTSSLFLLPPPPNLLLAADIRMSRQLLLTTILVIILGAQVLVTHGHTEGGIQAGSAVFPQPLGRETLPHI